MTPGVKVSCQFSAMTADNCYLVPIIEQYNENGYGENVKKTTIPSG